MTRPGEPVFTFTDKGIPTLAEAWNGTTVPPVMEFPPTESGRRARGELESMIEHIVKDWFVNHQADTICTAEYITRRCIEIDGRPTASDSVWNVLKKWEQIGFCKVAERPRRFYSFEIGAFRKGLPELYRQHKRKVRNTKKFGRFGYDQDGT